MDMFRRRFRRSSRGPSATWTKNQFNQDQSILGNTAVPIILVNGVKVNGAIKVIGTEVPAGAIVSQIDVYLNLIVPSGSGNATVVYFVICRRAGQSAVPASSFTAIGLSDMRNQVIRSEMTMIGTEDAGPLRTKFKVKIPKTYQRIREGDDISLIVQSTEASEMSAGCRYRFKQ